MPDNHGKMKPYFFEAFELVGVILVAIKFAHLLWLRFQ